MRVCMGGVYVFVSVVVYGGRGCLVCVSLSENDLGAEGGAAMAGAVHHLTSLTTLKYV